MRAQWRQPASLAHCIPNHILGDGSDWDAVFVLWDAIREELLQPTPKTIEAISETLVQRELVTGEGGDAARQSVRDLIFAVIGWSTMLYRPNPSPDLPGQYSILSETGSHGSEAHICRSQPNSAGRKAIPIFLLGFGVMLPPSNYCALDDEESKAAFSAIKAVSSATANAHILTKIGHVRFQWIDCLSCHLEFDRSSNTLYLYRFPSFCVASLQAHDTEYGRSRSVLHRCVLDGPPRPDLATQDDISQLLREILLSYRLIFGQDRRSRKLFRSLGPPRDHSHDIRDPLLVKLCTSSTFECPGPVSLVERQEYDVSGDFPHLRGKLSRLCDFMGDKQPRSLKDLWLDNRNSGTWLTFWAVLIFGSVSIFFATVQTVFAILQYTAEIA